MQTSDDDSGAQAPAVPLQDAVALRRAERARRDRALVDARRIIAHPSMIQSSPEWRAMVTDLLAIIDIERNHHREEVRELQRDAQDGARYAAAEARHEALSEFGGRDI